MIARSAERGRFPSPPRLRTLALVPGWVAVVVATVVFALGGSLSLRYQLLPLVFSVVLLGLPHGAVDHLAIPRTRGEAVTAGWLGTVGGLYLLAGGLYALAWFRAPAFAAPFFILLTWAHWGQGDLYPLAVLSDGAYPRSSPTKLITAATRGALPMAVPFVSFPRQYERVVVVFVNLFEPGAVASVRAVFAPAPRLAVAIVVGALATSAVLLGFISTAGNPSARSVWWTDAAEIGLLLAFFSFVPPIFAVGLYFCLWHSLRHVVRLIAVDPDAAASLSDGRYGAAILAFARDAVPLTAGSVLLLGGMYFVIPGSLNTPLDLVAGYLVLIAVLTLPHAVIVTWMDREQRLWIPGG